MARPGYALGIKGGAQTKSLIVTLAGPVVQTFPNAVSYKLRMPETGKVIGVSLNVGLRGGTHVTSSIDVTNAGTSLLAAAFDVDALTPGTMVDKEGAALASAAESVAKDAELRITTAESGGTSPTFGATTVQIDYIPLGD